jgi:thymidylate synthase (FAD)
MLILLRTWLLQVVKQDYKIQRIDKTVSNLIWKEDEEDIKLDQQWRAKQDAVIMAADKAYRWAIDNGIAKEQARVVLPEGLTKTRLYMNGTLRSWVHYIELRSAHGTQKEHMEIAKECAKVIAEIFPLAHSL